MHLVRRVCLRCLSAIDRGRTGAAPDVVPFIVRAFRRLLQLLHRGVGLVIAHCQVAEDIVFCLISCGVPTRVALQGQTIQCRVLVATGASSAMFACCGARAWLCPVEALEVVLEVILQRHVFGRSARVRSSRRRNLVIDRLKVPGQALQPDSRGRLETR